MKSICAWVLAAALTIGVLLCARADTAYNEALRLRIPGDADGDAAVSTTDARLMLQHAAGKIGDDALDVAGADIDGDGKLTTDDARAALQAVAGKVILPRPQSLPFTEAGEQDAANSIPLIGKAQKRICGDYRWMDGPGTSVLVVQTAAEWRYVRAYYACMTDGDGTPCDLGAYDEAFFKDSALVLCDKRMSDMEWVLEITSGCQSGDTLSLYLRRYYFDTVNHGQTPSLCRRIALSACPKSALQGVENVAVHVQYDPAPPV